MGKKCLLLFIYIFFVRELSAQTHEIRAKDKGKSDLIANDTYEKVVNKTRFQVKLISKTEKTLPNGNILIYSKEKFIDNQGNEYIRVIEKEIEPGEILSIEGGFILDNSAFDMKLSKNKNIRQKIFRIIKAYYTYINKTKSKNPLILKIASSPEYQGTYQDAQRHNYQLTRKRLKNVAKLVRIYASKISKIPLKIKVELSKDGMNFPTAIRNQLNNTVDNLEKNKIYQNFLRGQTQKEFQKLRIAYIYFEKTPIIKSKKVDIIPMLIKKIEKAVLILTDPSASMSNDIKEIYKEIDEINKIRKQLNHALIKIKSITVKSIIGDTESEMHLETLDSIIRFFPKRKFKDQFDKIIIYTDEPDCSYRNGYQVNVEKQYRTGMHRAVNLLSEKGYELLFVINNPENSQDKRLIHLTKNNVDEFCDVFYDKNRRKNNNNLLSIDTQNWYNNKIKSLGVKVSTAEFLQNQVALIRDL